MDPRLGRFISTDPVVSNVWNGQTFNAYAYVNGNPLSLVDPNGFEPSEPSFIPPAKPWPEYPDPPKEYINVCNGPKCPGMEGVADDEDSSEEFGAAVPPTDVDTTGSSWVWNVDGLLPGEDHRQNKYVQTEVGFIGGIGLGIVPYAAMGRQALEEARVMAPGTRDFSVGRSLGEIVGGFLCLVGGATGNVLGAVLSIGRRLLRSQRMSEPAA